MEKITSLLNEIENLKTQVKGKMPVITSNCVMSKDSLDPLCEIVKEDRIAKPHDNAVAHACTTLKPVQHPKVKKFNVPISQSIEVNSDTKASRSKPRSNIKNDRTSTAKSVPKKKVEDHIRNTKSDLHKQNRVDSSISLKRIIANSISDSRCKTFQALDLNVNKMESADNTSGPALQRKERCTLQCALSLEEEKSEFQK
ncbi:hypothetical protein Tco_1438295 [Tanacetum coccineum]